MLEHLNLRLVRVIYCSDATAKCNWIRLARFQFWLSADLHTAVLGESRSGTPLRNWHCTPAVATATTTTITSPVAATTLLLIHVATTTTSIVVTSLLLRSLLLLLLLVLLLLPLTLLPLLLSHDKQPDRVARDVANEPACGIDIHWFGRSRTKHAQMLQCPIEPDSGNQFLKPS